MEEFNEKYPDRESFEKDYPIGYKFYWWNKEPYHIVSYFEDDGLYVVIKSWTRYRQQWCYEVISAFGLWDGLQLLAKH